jgi:long-chain acyl-CoA synthetase
LFILFSIEDIGEIFPDGTLKIIDRKKDLVKLQSGEYISLGKVEAELKNCQFVDNICVYGDSFYTYLVGLVVPNPESIRALAEKLSKPENISFSDLCLDKDIVNTVLTAIQKFGIKSNLQKIEIPSKIKLCCEEWVPESGLVTAALKIRRKKIQEFYLTDIYLMYGIENALRRSISTYARKVDT